VLLTDFSARYKEHASFVLSGWKQALEWKKDSQQRQCNHPIDKG